MPAREDSIVPTIVQLELVKWAWREAGSGVAERVLGYTMLCQIVPLDTRIVVSAAEISRLQNFQQQTPSPRDGTMQMPILLYMRCAFKGLDWMLQHAERRSENKERPCSPTHQLADEPARRRPASGRGADRRPWVAEQEQICVKARWLGPGMRSAPGAAGAVATSKTSASPPSSCTAKPAAMHRRRQAASHNWSDAFPPLAEMPEVADAGDDEEPAEDHPPDHRQDCRVRHCRPPLLRLLIADRAHGRKGIG